MSKILIAYYSRKGQNYVNGSIKNLAKGNTEVVAEFVQKAVGGDLFEIDTVKKYAEDYTQCTVEAQEELREKARPELSKYLDSIDEYDTIFLGYPCWWGTMSAGKSTTSAFPRLSLLVGDDAHGLLYVFGALRYGGQENHSLLHP